MEVSCSPEHPYLSTFVIYAFTHSSKYATENFNHWWQVMLKVRGQPQTEKLYPSFLFGFQPPCRNIENKLGYAEWLDLE